jgi:hypothetical protein
MNNKTSFLELEIVRLFVVMLYVMNVNSDLSCLFLVSSTGRGINYIRP